MTCVCGRDVPRAPEWLRINGTVVKFCTWRCLVLARGDDEARRIAETLFKETR